MSPFLKGEDTQLGLAKESNRGNFASPSDWIRLRAPASLQPTIEGTVVDEAMGSGVDAQGHEVTQLMAEGEVEYNVRNTTFGFLLLSLLGNVNSGTFGSESSVYQHTFSYESEDPQHPSLSYALSQGGGSVSFQDYAYLNGVVQSAEITIPVDDTVNATSNLMATSESAQSDFSPSYGSDDYLFNHYDVTVTHADSKSGLSSGTEINPQEITLNIENELTPRHRVGSQNPQDLFANRLSVEGSVTLDYQDETFHDLFTGNGTKALQIQLVKTDTTIGSSSNPQATFKMAEVHFDDRSLDRSLDSVVGEDLNFKAVYNKSNAEALETSIVNETASY